ncbi:hypothetical protein F5I97DRAFT_1845286 [Phlebopus sp. FC_14]|nr:hypothetical protein F5I97DRAFT_1845286 [Phlebopus sp. FC_14]
MSPLTSYDNTMPGSGFGNVKDVSSSRTEALQGLLHSLGIGATSPEQLQNLSDKIQQILGDSSGISGDGEVQQDENGQLLNADGLPIIDISEPISDEERLHPSVQELDTTPPSSLPPSERERWRHERDRILDLLEEEERLQQLKEQKDEEEERREAIRRRKESAKLELQRLKAAKDLQMKMGKAFIQNLSGREKEVAVPKNPQASAALQMKVISPDHPAANERGKEAADAQQDVYLGNVTAGRLRSSSRAPIVSMAQDGNYPVKMQVVERRPGSSVVSPISLTNVVDSDDESITADASQGKENAELTEEEADHTSEQMFGSDEDESSDEEPIDDLDWDSAQHHREIALEYLRKRHAIGSDVAKAMSTPSHDDDESTELELSDAGVPSQHSGKPALSRFRADRMTAIYDRSQTSVSTSLGPSVIPAARQKSLQSAVRVGKLENDQLVGGVSGESGSEDEGVKEVLRMLKNSEIQNVGPSFTPSSRTQDSSPSSAGTSTNPPGKTSAEPKLSRFKMTHVSRTTESTSIAAVHANAGSEPRSKPVMSGVFEHKPTRRSRRESVSLNWSSRRHAGEVKATDDSNSAAMIIESPSFPSTTNPSLDISVSPSFPAPTKLSNVEQEVPKQNARPQRPPAIMSSTVIESSRRQNDFHSLKENRGQKTSRFMAGKKTVNFAQS